METINSLKATKWLSSTQQGWDQEQQSQATAPSTEQPGKASAPASTGPATSAATAVAVEDQGQTLVGEVSDLSGLVSDLKGKETPAEILITLLADVLFEFDKADIKPQAHTDLRKLINEKGRGPVLITGHTDAKGENDYNVALSVRRAEAVKNWLTNNGLFRPDEVQTSGKGESQPVAPNQKPDGSDDPEGRQKNRRVDIVIRKTAS